MLDKLESIRARFEEVGISLTNPEVVADNRQFTTLSRE
jgi:peptide chain release factor 1